MNQGLASRIAATRFGVWAIKHIVSPVDRLLFRLSRGRFVSSGKPLAPLILLTTTGRNTGRTRTHPVFALPDGKVLVICNVRPLGERRNPWPGNVDAHPAVGVDLGDGSKPYTAHRATKAEMNKYWPKLVAMWPTYATHFTATGERSVFVLSPSVPQPVAR